MAKNNTLLYIGIGIAGVVAYMLLTKKSAPTKPTAGTPTPTSTNPVTSIVNKVKGIVNNILGNNPLPNASPDSNTYTVYNSDGSFTQYYTNTAGQQVSETFDADGNPIIEGAQQPTDTYNSGSGDLADNLLG